MAQLTYTRIDDNAARSVAAINTFWASATTQSTNITGPNWRDEGLDERTLNSAAAYTVSASPYIEYNSGYVAKNSAAAWASLVLGATTFTLAGGWTQGRDVGVIRIRFATEFFYTFGGHPAGNSATIAFRLTYREDGGAVTPIPDSTRTFYTNDDVAVVVGTGYIDYYYDNFKYAFLAPYTDDGASHTLTSIGVQYNTSAAGYQIGNTTLTTAKLVRAVN